MSGIPVTTKTGIWGLIFLSDRTKSAPETLGITWSVTMTWNGVLATFNSASAPGPVVAIETIKPPSRSTASRMLSCTGLSSITRTWIEPGTLGRPLSVLLHHFLLCLQPILLFQVEPFTSPTLFIQFVGAHADQFIQSRKRFRI